MPSRQTNSIIRRATLDTCSLLQQLPGIVDVIVYPSVDSAAPNRGFCFVECVDHACAVQAYR